MSDRGATLRQFMSSVWDHGDLAAVDRLVGPQYTIYSDPGDPWDGQTLSREGFKERVVRSRAPFPDLRFEIDRLLDGGEQIAIAWVMRGTNTVPMGDRPATGRQIAVRGMTIYRFEGDRIVGHHQVVDRLAVAQQLGLFGPPVGGQAD
ncbi:MAG TPA: ester cyclase [Vicinamibacterales bacterium]|nr:ester cyclase [Vicinamibacterales bacterium]